MGAAGQVELPGGRVTFVFTDIESSSRLLSRLGPAYDDLLDVHHETLRGVWAAHRGHEVNTEGDAFFVAFPSADDAVAAAAAAQRALAAATWPHGARPQVRIGVHTGYAQPRHGDYVALAVNQAARVVGAAHGGQVLVSADTVAAMAGESSITLVPHGRFRVRDFDDPQLLYGVEADGWDDPGRPPRVRPADGHNLVAALTDLVDRQSEMSWLETMVRPGVLATVTGPGGGGKTRLAVELGFRVVHEWEDGVWFVDLLPVRGADHVAEAIAESIGASATPGAPVLDDLRVHLEARRALLILDNCEHVATPAALVVHELLTRCPGIGVVATSRVPLGLTAEKVLRLAPLPYDTEESPAVELFLGVAADAAADDMAIVRRLCEQLDGIPLALELAAVRTRAIPTRAILDRLHSDPGVVHSNDPTLPDRHRSIERVLDWSWGLLTEPAQAALQRLAVLAGSFTQSTAMAACADEAIRPHDVPEQLWTLVDHSLVLADLGSGESRYRVLAPVRSYAVARSDGADVTRTVVALARHYHAALGPERVASRAWASEMSTELDNVRGVVRDLAGLDDELGQALAWSIGRYHDLIGAYATCVSDIGNALDLFPAGSKSRVGLLTLRAYVHLRTGRVDDARRDLEEADALAGRVGLPAWDDVCLVRVQGELALRRGDAAAAAALAQAGLESTSNPRSRDRMWNLLGLALAEDGDLASAIDAFEAELTSAVEAGLDVTLSKVHGNIAEAALQLGMRSRAAHHQLECLELARTNGEPVLVAYSVMVAARLLAEDAPELVRAAMLHEAAVHALDASGHVLYGVDAAVGDDFRRQLAVKIGPAAFAEATLAGRNCGLDAAAEQAREVLEGVINEAR